MIKKIAMWILGKEFNILNDKISNLKNQKEILKLKNESLSNKIKKIKYPNPKEEELNNKYPKKDIQYRVTHDKTYLIDVRNFIQEYDSTIPSVSGKTDDEKALNGLKFVKNNIKYTKDKSQYGLNEYWCYAYQTWKNKKGDCEDGAILLYNILLKSGIPYWKLRLSAGDVVDGGHAYLTYYCEEQDKWVILDWCYYPNNKKIKDRKHYKDDEKYGNVWFSWNQKYAYTKGLNTKAKRLLK